MIQELKFIYETTVNKKVIETIKETKEENGQKIEISKEVSKIKPIKLGILKPDRKLSKGAELFFSKSLSNYLKEGLLPYSLVAKRYANDGGPLTESEIKRIVELKEQLAILEKEFFIQITDKTEESQQKKADLLLQINEINIQISNIQNSYAEIFDNTAEIKSRNDTIEWWVLHLTYLSEDDKKYQPLFNKNTYDEKIKELEKIEDDGDEFYREIIKRSSYLISFWLSAKTDLTILDFQTMERLYLDTATSYNVEESINIEEPAKSDNALEVNQS